MGDVVQLRDPLEGWLPPPPTDGDFVGFDVEDDDDIEQPEPAQLEQPEPATSSVEAKVHRIAVRLAYSDALAGSDADAETRLALVDLATRAGADGALTVVRRAAFEGQEAGAARRRANNTASADDPWPARKELPTLPPAPALDPELLPARLRGWIEDVAEHANLPIEMIAATALSSLGAVAGRKFAIEPSPGFFVVGNLWSLFVAPPSMKKSAALSAGKAPLGSLIARARDEHKQAELAARARRAALKKKIAQAEKGTDGSVDEALLVSLYREYDETKSTEHRYTTSDSTVAALGQLLIENPNGMFVCRDEIAGLFAMLNDPRAPGDREFYLEAWVGTGDHTLDRIGRGLNLYIPYHCLSVAGATQPGKIRVLVDDALGDGARADGLLQRFQVFVWPDRLPKYQRCSRLLDREAESQAYGVYRWLDEVSPADLGLPRNERGWHTMHFDADAQAIYDDWLDNLEDRLRTSDELADAPAFAAHLGKFRSLVPKLALLFELADELDGAPVSVQSVEKALGWAAFLEAHARKLYSAELHPGRERARLLAAKIQAGAVEHGSTVRSLYKPRWRGLDTPEKVAVAIAELEAVGWVRQVPEVGPKGGRPSMTIQLHPSLRSQP